MSKQLVEALKELIRTFIGGEIWTVTAVIAIIASGINKELGTFIIPWNVALAVFVADTLINFKVGLSSAADKWLHTNDIKTVLDLESLDRLEK